MNTLFKKPMMMIVISLIVLQSAIGVIPAYAATLTVTNTNDSGAGSLRDTLAIAAASDTINFDASLAGTTIHLASTITLSQDVTIDGSALTVPVTISGDSNSDGVGDVQILNINSGVTVVLDSLIFAKGRATSNTSGAIEDAGTLTINNSTFADNYADNGGGAIFSYGPILTITNSTFTRNISAYGGGALQAVNTTNISNSTFSYNSNSNSLGGGALYSAGTLTVANSTFTHNSSTTHAGGIDVVNGTATITGSTFDHNSAAGGASIAIETGTATVSNSTFASNTTTGIAGGIYNNGTLNLYNSTFSDNSAVVGTDVANFGTLTFANNIMANTVSGSGLSCYNVATIGTNTNNLIEDTSPTCSPALSGDPMLDTLADNGGPTQTIALLPGSPAIDAGNDPTCAADPVSNLDQRGVTRPVGAHCDLGAVEYVATYFVTKAADTNDGTCDSDCSLREAVVAANADADGDTILFNGDYTITLGASLPSATDNLTIDGKGHTVILDGANTYGIMDAQASLHLKNLTIQHASNGNGGAILTRSPSSIANVTFTNNTASSNGGAVYNYQTTLTITNSTFDSNSATGGGGAIKNDTGTLIVSNSTFSNNSAGTGGAVIALYSSSNVTTTIYNSTFSGNNATTQAGGIYSNGTLNYANTIIANSTTNNIPGGDCANDGTLGINFNNLVEDASCSALLSGDPILGALANNGGSTQTLALLAHSTAINAGNDAICLLTPINNLDQRGITRPDGSHCDLGAYEYVDTTAPNITVFTATSQSPSLNIPITTFTASDDVAVTVYLITESATPPSAGDSGWSASIPTTYAVSSAGTHILYPWAKDGIGNVSSVYGSPATVHIIETFTVSSAAAQDGWVLETSETSNLGGTINSSASTFRLGDDATKKQYRGILLFNTSALPDTGIVITSVTLKVKKQGIAGGGNPVNTFQGFMVDIKKGLFGTSTLQTSDFQTVASKTYGPFIPTPVSNWYSINLTNGRNYINRLTTNGGSTQIRLRFKLDDNNNTIANYLSLFSGNAGAASRPQLIIEYYTQ